MRGHQGSLLPRSKAASQSSQPNAAFATGCGRGPRPPRHWGGTMEPGEVITGAGWLSWLWLCLALGVDEAPALTRLAVS